MDAVELEKEIDYEISWIKQNVMRLSILLIPVDPKDGMAINRNLI